MPPVHMHPKQPKPGEPYIPWPDHYLCGAKGRAYMSGTVYPDRVTCKECRKEMQ